jgi:hypothetical protein
VPSIRTFKGFQVFDDLLVSLNDFSEFALFKGSRPFLNAEII